MCLLKAFLPRSSFKIFYELYWGDKLSQCLGLERGFDKETILMQCFTVILVTSHEQQRNRIQIFALSWNATHNRERVHLMQQVGFTLLVLAIIVKLLDWHKATFNFHLALIIRMIERFNWLWMSSFERVNHSLNMRTEINYFFFRFISLMTFWLCLVS